MARRLGTLAAALAVALAAAPASARAQRDVGPVRVGLFGGVRLGHESRPLLGVAGELELPSDLHGIWTLAVAASTVTHSNGNYAQYELDARWRSGSESGSHFYAGAGVVVARTAALMSGGPSETRLGGLALAGLEVAVVGTTAFVEALALEDGDLTGQVRGGLRLLLIGK